MLADNTIYRFGSNNWNRNSKFLGWDRPVNQCGVKELEMIHTEAVGPPEGKPAALERPDGGFRGSKDSPIEIRDVNPR